MTTFNPVHNRRWNQGSALFPSSRVPSTGTPITQDLGTLTSSGIRASGTVTKSQPIFYKFVVPTDPTAVTVLPRGVGFTLRDKTKGSIADKSINAKYRINLFDNNNNQLPLNGGGNVSDLTKRLALTADIVPGSYSLRIRSRGATPKQYTLFTKLTF